MGAEGVPMIVNDPGPMMHVPNLGVGLSAVAVDLARHEIVILVGSTEVRLALVDLVALAGMRGEAVLRQDACGVWRRRGAP